MSKKRWVLVVFLAYCMLIAAVAGQPVAIFAGFLLLVTIPA